MSFEWHLVPLRVLALARYWGISEQHTLLGYEDGLPAALIILPPTLKLGKPTSFTGPPFLSFAERPDCDPAVRKLLPEAI